jgi:hypothetical protein
MPTNTTIRFGSGAMTATSAYRLSSSASGTNGAVIKAGRGTVFNITAANASSTARYLKLYNKASVPAVGTDIPLWVGMLPGQDSMQFIVGLTFSAGIAMAITAGEEDSDSTAVAAGDIKSLNIAYT